MFPKRQKFQKTSHKKRIQIVHKLSKRTQKEHTILLYFYFMSTKFIYLI